MQSEADARTLLNALPARLGLGLGHARVSAEFGPTGRMLVPPGIGVSRYRIPAASLGVSQDGVPLDDAELGRCVGLLEATAAQLLARGLEGNVVVAEYDRGRLIFVDLRWRLP